MSRLKRVAPATALALVAVLGLLIALLTADPPGVTLRSDLRGAAPVELPKGQDCFALPVLPNDTRLVRVQAAPGAKLPTSVSVAAQGMTPISSGPGQRREPDRVEYRLAKPTSGERGDAQVCMNVAVGGATLLGEGERPAVTLLGDPHSNWISALPALADRAGFGRGTVLGRAALPLALLLLAAAWLLAVREVSGAGRRPEPVGRGSIVRVGVVGALFCAAFALTTPPFQAPDEMVHLQYAELLADQQALPRTTEYRGDATSPQGGAAINGMQTGRVAFSPDRRPPWSQTEDRAFDAQLKALPSGGAVDSFTNASSQPPAYYAIVAVAQTVTGGSILDRVLVGRLISALLFGIGAAGAVAFAREAVPRAGGLAIAGGLFVATLPIVGFIGGSINPDALLTAVAAWTLAVLARILRQGATLRRGALLGLLLGLGLATKLIFAALLPAVAVAAIVVLVRGLRGREFSQAILAVLAAGAAMAVVAGPYLAWAVLSGRGIAFSPPPAPGAVAGPVLSMRETVVYAVELFVGQFGPITDRIPGSGPWDLWLSGLTGRMGWVDYGVPTRWVHVIGAFWGLLALLAVVGIGRSARARRTVPIDAVVYAVAAGGLALMIARAGLYNRMAGASGFEQARYLFPIAAIGAGGVALGLRQLPKPIWRDWAAATVVVFGLVDGTVGFLLTVGRYFA